MMQGNPEEPRRRRRKARWLLFPLLALLAGGLYVAIDGDEPGEDVAVQGAQASKPDKGNGNGKGQGPTEEVAGAVELRPGAPDNRAPSVAISAPANNAVVGPNTWGACSPAGVCGTASDASGVAAVQVSLRQEASGLWWNGTAFAPQASAVFNDAAGTTAWTLPLALPAEGAYVVSARAVDIPGNVSGLVTRRFTVDSTAPPAPAFTATPDDVTFEKNAQFRFSSSEPGVSYRCQLDSQPVRDCGSNGVVNENNLPTSDHVFRVWAVDAAGNVSVPAEWHWTILIKQSFRVSGDADQPLSPGTTSAVNLVIDNPFNFPLRVVEVTMSAAGPSACPAGANLQLTQGDFQSEGFALVVPAGSSRSLSSLSVPLSRWPRIHMRNLSTNQDACKNVTFELSYEGTGTKS